MGRYELGDQTWSIERSDDRLVIVEPDGSERVEHLPAPGALTTRFRVLTNQKMRAGWKLVADVPAPASVTPRPPVELDASNSELEEQIFENPNDPQAWLIYGDWLQQRGDPRGEYIALLAASRAAPADVLARSRFQAFEARHRDYCAGGANGVLGWGFLDRIFVKSAAELEVLSTLAGRFIRSISTGTMTTATLAAVFEAIAAREPRALRELSISDGVTVPSLAPLPLATLTGLELHGSISPVALATLVTAPMPRLGSLLMVARDIDLEPLLARTGLALTSLSLDAIAGASLCTHLAASTIATTLESLDLPGLDDAGATVLYDHLERFPALRTLGVSESLDVELVRAFHAALGEIHTVHSRYAAIQE